MCVACRTRRPSGEMLRWKAEDQVVVRSHHGDKNPGRGCYTCPTANCVNRGIKRAILTRALRKPILVLPAIEKILEGLEQEGETR
jgi:uncharacterized protein